LDGDRTALASEGGAVSVVGGEGHLGGVNFANMMAQEWAWVEIVSCLANHLVEVEGRLEDWQ
jgi:hypothetical protein